MTTVKTSAASSAVYDLIFRTNRFWRDSVLRKNLFFAAAFLLACDAFHYFAFFPADKNFAVFVPFFAVEWFFAAAIYHLCAVLVGGRGNVANFLYLWAFTSAPFLFLPAARIFGEAVFGGSVFFLFFAATAVYLWVFVLRVGAVKSNYHLNSAQAVFVLILPVFLILLLFILSAVFYLLVLLLW
ncbi:MAG: hypothetical protein J7L54_03135 [Elusimicrobia bacterium]|nr:hypothetical protein [Elusimicrobiota bacterium]